MPRRYFRALRWYSQSEHKLSSGTIAQKQARQRNKMVKLRRLPSAWGDNNAAQTKRLSSASHSCDECRL